MESTTQGIKKDYVQMSISILRDGSKDDQLRKWAVSVIDANSPIKFNASLKDNLEQGKTFIPARFVMPPAALMEPPRPLKSITKRPITVKDLIENDIENDEIAKDNAIQLWHLQQVLKVYSDTYSGKTARTPPPIPDYIMNSGMRGTGHESSPAHAGSSIEKSKSRR